MNPIDVIEGRAKWAIVQADCLSPDGMPALPDRSVAHVITDPPYEAEAHTKARRIGKGGHHKTAGSVEYAIGFDAIDEATRDGVAREAVRCARGWFLAFCQVEAVGTWRATMTAAGGKWARGMVWVKPCAAPQFTGDRPGMGHESIATAWAGGGRMRWNGGGKHGVYVHPIPQARTGDRIHPTIKPLPLMEALIADFTDPGDIVLDPFAGSGTTGLACLRLGRRFIGFERDPAHYETAVRRLSGDEVRPVPGQIVMFGATP